MFSFGYRPCSSAFQLQVHAAVFMSAQVTKSAPQTLQASYWSKAKICHRKESVKQFQIEVTEVWRNRRAPILPSMIRTYSESSLCGIFLEIDSEYFASGKVDPAGQLFLHLCNSVWRKTMTLDATQKGDLEKVARNCTAD